MIETIKPSHSYEQYMECVSDLMGCGIESTPREFYDRVTMMPKNREVFVDIIDNKIVATGSILMEYKLRYKTPKVYIEDIAVHSDYRYRGIGRKMVEWCISEARARNAYKIVLTCTDELLPFYKDVGFSQDVNFMVV